jgi:hypothetical protein
MSATKTKVQSIIDENPVAVFSKSYCPYCNAAKKLLSESGAKFYAIELDQVGKYNVRSRAPSQVCRLRIRDGVEACSGEARLVWTNR